MTSMEKREGAGRTACQLPPAAPPQPHAEPSTVTKHPPAPGGLNINEPVGVLGPVARPDQEPASLGWTPNYFLRNFGPGAQITGSGSGRGPGSARLHKPSHSSVVSQRVSEQRAILTRVGSALLLSGTETHLLTVRGSPASGAGGLEDCVGESGSCCCFRCLISHQISTLWSRAPSLAHQLGPHPPGAPSLPGSQPILAGTRLSSGPRAFVHLEQFLRNQLLKRSCPGGYLHSTHTEPEVQGQSTGFSNNLVQSTDITDGGTEARAAGRQSALHTAGPMRPRCCLASWATREPRAPCLPVTSVSACASPARLLTWRARPKAGKIVTATLQPAGESKEDSSSPGQSPGQQRGAGRRPPPPAETLAMGLGVGWRWWSARSACYSETHSPKFPGEKS